MEPTTLQGCTVNYYKLIDVPGWVWYAVVFFLVCAGIAKLTRWFEEDSNANG